MLYQHNYVLTAQQEILQLDQTQGIIHGAAPVKKVVARKIVDDPDRPLTALGTQ